MFEFIVVELLLQHVGPSVSNRLLETKAMLTVRARIVLVVSHIEFILEDMLVVI